MRGRAIEEAVLADGDLIEWCGKKFLVGVSAPVLIEEVEAEPVFAPGPDGLDPEAPGPVRAAQGRGHEAEARAWKRLQAGMLVELGLADRRAAKRWQAAVTTGSFEPDACARDILGTSRVSAEDPRLLERSARLERDLLMAPVQRGERGAGRKMRTAARGGLAVLLAQAVAIVVYSLLVLAALLVTRSGSGRSIDAILDSILDLIRVG
jgi:hypothetical protein